MIKEGDIVSNLIPGETVRITKVQALGSLWSVRYEGTNTNKTSTKVLNQSQIEQLDVIAADGEFNFKGDPEKFVLFAEAERINSAYQFDPLFAINCSVVDPLPHQVEAVYKFLLPQPKIRFLLADDTGAGKTIMTGLLIKEMMMRGILERVLIVTPGGLTKQWQEDEMGVKFNIPFTLANRASFDAEPTIFQAHNRIVTSIDFLCREDVMNVVSNTTWDLVVFDEAHKLSAYEYGTKTYRSRRYEAAAQLSKQCEHILLLTATPHRGRTDTFKRLLQILDESVFAANLAEVALGIGRELYIDRTMFFEKTYITTGLKDLANRVIQALNGEETENRVISLMTGFGGGKTHSLISLFHIAKAGKELLHTSVASSLLKDGVKPTFEGAHVAAFTNNTTDVSQGHTTPDGITVHTIWGEIAYQLAGKDGYEIVRKNDEDMIAPSGGIFKKVLEMSTPALILVDELAAYCVTASAKKVGASNLSDQTISFMQTLTEVVAEVPRCMLIVTLPQSNTEVGATQQAQDILTALQNRVIRVGTNVQPVQEDEIYEVIRRRLFESIGDPAIVKRVVEKYGKYYSHLGGVMPSKVTNGTYREVMRKSYPFHPELIEIFRQKWGQDSRFQRTRGVLRLLASIVNDLWQRRTSLVGTQGLIQTSDVNLSNLHSLTGTILNLKGAQWDSVFHADVMGSTSNAYRIDNENPESNMAKFRLAQGVATTIMLSSVAGKHNSFITLSELKLNMVRPGTFPHAEIDNALARLEGVAHYLYSNRDGERHYWFESRANVNILINQAKSQISREAIDADIEKRLKAQIDGTMPFRVLVCPTLDVPEQKSLTLAILGPQYLSNGQLNNKTKTTIETIAKQKGSTPRTFRNTILYLVCTEQGYNILSDKIRNYLASQKVLDEYGNLEKDQRDDVLGRKRTADSEISQALINAYTQVVKFSAQTGFELLPHFSIQASNFKDYLTYDVLNALKDEEWVIRGVGRGMLNEINLIPSVDTPVQVSKLYETFLRYDDKPMITGPDAITSSIQKFVSERTFNLAHGEPGHWTKIDVGFTSPFLQADDTNAWLVDPSVKMSEPTTTGSGGTSGTGATSTGAGAGSGTASGGGTGSTQPKLYKHVHIQGSIPMEHWTDLFGSFVQTLRNNKLKISVKFDASSTDISELTENSQLFKSLKESASQLGLELTTEE